MNNALRSGTASSAAKAAINEPLEKPRVVYPAQPASLWASDGRRRRKPWNKANIEQASYAPLLLILPRCARLAHAGPKTFSPGGAVIATVFAAVKYSVHIYFHPRLRFSPCRLAAQMQQACWGALSWQKPPPLAACATWPPWIGREAPGPMQLPPLGHRTNHPGPAAFGQLRQGFAATCSAFRSHRAPLQSTHPVP